MGMGSPAIAAARGGNSGAWHAGPEVRIRTVCLAAVARSAEPAVAKAAAKRRRGPAVLVRAVCSAPAQASGQSFIRQSAQCAQHPNIPAGASVCAYLGARLFGRDGGRSARRRGRPRAMRPPPRLSYSSWYRRRRIVRQPSHAYAE